MKKLVAVLMAGIVLMTGMTALAETNQTIDVVFGQIKLVVDGYQVDKETLLYNDTTYIPLRAAAEVLGKEIRYDDFTKTAYIDTVKTDTSQNVPVADKTGEDSAIKSPKEIDVIFGQIKLVVDGGPLDKETLLYTDTTYIPLRAAAEVLGKEVRYDDLTKTAFISTPKTEEEPVQDEPVIEYYKNFPTVPTFESVTGLPKDIGTTDQKGSSSIASTIHYNYEDISASDLEIYRNKLKSMGFEDYSSDTVRPIADGFVVKLDLPVEWIETEIWVIRTITVSFFKYNGEFRLLLSKSVSDTNATPYTPQSPLPPGFNTDRTIINNPTFEYN